MKIYVTLAQAKILHSVLDILSVKARQISRKQLVEKSGIDNSNLSKIVQNKYLLENDLTKNKNQNSTKGDQNQ